jgi:hypothetical protein
MLYRLLGSTGERVSAIGLGGSHIGKPALTEIESVRLIHEAVDRGITFLEIIPGTNLAFLFCYLLFGRRSLFCLTRLRSLLIDNSSSDLLFTPFVTPLLFEFLLDLLVFAFSLLT